MPSKTFFKPDVEEALFNFLDSYEADIRNLVNEAEDPANRAHYRKLKNYTHNIFWRRAQLDTVTTVFGSRAIGISNPKSDLDLYVHVEKSGNISDKSHAIEVLQKVKRTMTGCKIWRPKIIIRDTPVPLLRVVFLPLNLELDIVASNPIGISDSNIFCHIVELQPEVKHFFHFIRMWLKELNDVKLKKMIIFYLVVFYLQRVNILPTLERVHKGVPKKLVDGWEVQFDAHRTISSYQLNAMDNYENYIIDFFKFFGNVSLADSVIDMHSGKVIKRCDYKFKNFELNTNMCVAAPLDRDRNVARLVGKDTTMKFQKVCKNSAIFLRENSKKLRRREE